MVVIYIVAATVAAVVSPFDNIALASLLIPAFAFLLAAVWVLVLVVPYSHLTIRGPLCPACGKWRLTCSQVVLSFPLPSAVHRCPGCGSRYGRRFFGPWLELGAEDHRSTGPPGQAWPDSRA